MKILYVTTISNTVNAFLIPHIKMLIDEGHQVDVAFNIEQEIKPEIYEMGCKIHQLPLQRSPLKKDNFRAYRILKNIIISEGYVLVHTHTPVASAIVRLACRKLSSVKVFYTAHGFHFFKGAHMRNWLIYYPVEKWLSKYTDTLITINGEDYERAKKFSKAAKVKYIPGVGINLRKFQEAKIDRVTKRNEIGVPQNSFVLLSIGELNYNKNHEVVIRALSKIEHCDVHYVICGEGPLEDHLIDLSEKLEVGENLHLLGFRKDIPEICKVCDLFVFPSKREGLGLAAIEAMASGLPIITSDVHGIVDYSINGITGYTCSPNDVESLVTAINSMYTNKPLRIKIGKSNQNIAIKYNLSNILNELEKIYKGV